MGTCVLSLAHGSELPGSDVYLHIVEKTSGEFSLNLTRYVPLDGLLGGSVEQIIYREYIAFRDSNISCSLACTAQDSSGQIFIAAIWC